MDIRISVLHRLTVSLSHMRDRLQTSRFSDILYRCILFRKTPYELLSDLRSQSRQIHRVQKRYGHGMTIRFEVNDTYFHTIYSLPSLAGCTFSEYHQTYRRNEVLRPLRLRTGNREFYHLSPI